MGTPQRVVLTAALVAGAVGGILLFRSLRDPCGALLRRADAIYESKKACNADSECILDPLPARGPGLCDRARAASSGRIGLSELERVWAAAGCPAPGEPCPPIAGVRCEKGRCATLVQR